MGKPNVVHTYNSILFINKKKKNACYNMNDPQKHYAKWYKLHTKYYIMYNFIYMKCLGKANLCRARKKMSGCLRLAVGAGIECK